MEDISSQNKLLSKTFIYMFLGLLVSGGVAYYTYATNAILNYFDSNTFYILLFVEILVVLLFSFLFRKLPPVVVGVLYFAYAIINGITLSVIFYVFEMQSIVYLFLVSAFIFSGLAYFGYHTTTDLSNWRNYIFAFLIAGCVLSIINLFYHSTQFDLLVDWIVLIVFCVVTIYDLNKVKDLENDESINSDNIAIYCAMQIYLDFVNIFLRILSIANPLGFEFANSIILFS